MHTSESTLCNGKVHSAAEYTHVDLPISFLRLRHFQHQQHIFIQYNQVAYSSGLGPESSWLSQDIPCTCFEHASVHEKPTHKNVVRVSKNPTFIFTDCFNRYCLSLFLTDAMLFPCFSFKEKKISKEK